MQVIETFVCQNCGECCGPVPVTDDEWWLIRRAMEAETENRRLRSAIESARDSLTLSVADESMDRDAWTELALKTLEKALEVRE